jgi:SAM-dependent methyltransferase
VVADLLRRYLDGAADPTPERALTATGRQVLDVGSGTGEMTDMLREFGTVTALDDSAQAVEFCRARHPVGVSVRRGRVPEDLAGEKGYQLVTAFDVLEHIEDDRAALTALRAALAPGGRLVLTVPAFGALWSHHDVYAGHFRRYRRADLLRAIADAGGLRVERITYFNSLLFFPALAVRTMGRWRRRLAPRPQEHSDPHLAVPSPWVNRTLLRIFAAEAALLRRARLPFGVSLLVFCRAV